jgi:DHA2 family multidrug resistance protein
MFNNLVTSQSLMLATNALMMLIAVVYVAASIAIVLAPKAARTVDPHRWGFDFAVAHEGI